MDVGITCRQKVVKVSLTTPFCSWLVFVETNPTERKASNHERGSRGFDNVSVSTSRLEIPTSSQSEFVISPHTESLTSLALGRAAPNPSEAPASAGSCCPVPDSNGSGGRAHGISSPSCRAHSSRAFAAREEVLKRHYKKAWLACSGPSLDCPKRREKRLCSFRLTPFT
jgi:hypothetical protein